MLLLSCLVFLILTLFNYNISGRRITYPPFLFCSIWLFLFVFRIVFTQFYLQDIHEVYNGTYLLFIAGGFVTSISGYVILLQNSTNKPLEQGGARKRNFNAISSYNTFSIRLVLVLFFVALFPFFIKYIAAIVIASEVENIFKSIRYETAVVGKTFGIYAYAITFTAFLSLINGYAYWHNATKRNRYIYVGSLILGVLYGACTMGRTPVLSILSFNIALYLICNMQVNLFRLVKFAIAFCLFFIIIGVLLDKGGGVNNSFYENLHAGVETLGLYIISPMNAINEVLYSNMALQNGARTFRFFYVLLNAFGMVKIDLENFSIVDEFLFVPYPVNVYTFYNPYVRDYGFLFSLFSLAVFMIWHCWAFVKTINKPFSYFPILTYCFLFYPLIMTIFNDQYASIFSTWLQLYVFAGIYYLIVFLSRLINYKRVSKAA